MLFRSAIIFDKRSPYFNGNKDWDLMFLKATQRHANDRLMCGAEDGLEKHLYLNHVYQMLGLPEVSYGWRAGWIYNEARPLGDNYVYFEIKHYPQCSKIIVDFNVDGDIHPYVWGY